MAEPTPPQKVVQNFAMDKVRKRKFASIGGLILLLLVGAVFLKRRSQTDNPVTKAVEQQDRRAMNQGAPEVQGPGNAKNPMSPDNQSTAEDQVFLRSMQEFSKEQKEQNAAKEVQVKAQKEQAVNQARLEERKRIAATANGGTPPSIAPDGTVAPGQPGVLKIVPPPPRYGYATEGWLQAGQGRVRPAYQTGELYPSDPARHQELEQRYWDGMKSPVVVGLDPETNTAIERMKHDTRNIQGGIGCRTRNGVSEIPIPNVRRPAANPSDAGHWGDWIIVTPVPKQDPPPTKP